LLRKLLYLIPTRTEKKRALQIARTVRAEMTRYLATTTCINAGLGIAVGLATYLLGMPSPVLWGVMVALLNFVPYLGPLVNTGVLTIAALMSLEDVGRALAVPAIVYALDSLEGHFLTPIITGQTLDLNPVVILLGLLFSGWLWGVVGALIAIPMLVTLRILCDHIAPLAPISEFLSGKREEASEG
jgi:predicted PurR-regulated permease PerM